MENYGKAFGHLPGGWVQHNLERIATKITKGATPTTYGFTFLDDGINFIKDENNRGNSVDIKGIKHFISKEAHAYQKKSILEENDILFSIAGTIGNTCIIKKEHLPANTNQALAIIGGYSDLVVPKFLNLQLAFFITDSTKAKARGGAMNNISLGDLKNLGTIIPPLPEQHQIVAKIEELFSELDNGIENLKKAREQLKTYRQAVLKYAFEGKLTNQVYNGNLPENWKIEKLGDCLDIVSGNTPKGVNDIKNLGEIPFYKVGDMNTYGNEVYMKEANLNLTQDEVNSLKVKLFPKGTVIFPKRGGAILTNKKRVLSSFSGFDLNIMGAIPNENIDGLYLYYWFQKLDLSKIYNGSNVPQINRKNIAPLDIPIPSIIEQHQIVMEIESRLSVCDQLEQTIEDSLKKAEALRHSILKKAFAGELTRDWREKHPALITGANSAEKLQEKNMRGKASPSNSRNAGTN